MHRRRLRDNSNPFELPEERFIELYRLSKEATRYLIDTLDRHLIEGQYINAIPNYIKVFAALRFYATGSYQRGIGLSSNVGLSQTSVHRYVYFYSSVKSIRHDIMPYIDTGWLKCVKGQPLNSTATSSIHLYSFFYFPRVCNLIFTFYFSDVFIK